MKTMIVFRENHEYLAFMALDVDIRLLRMFSTLARLGSHTRTGEMLGLTQSAISHGIKRLEEQLGCALIYMKGKTTHLTPEGRHFLGQVLRILESLDRVADSAGGEIELIRRFAKAVVPSGSFENAKGTERRKSERHALVQDLRHPL